MTEEQPSADPGPRGHSAAGLDRPCLRALETHRVSDGEQPGVVLIDPLGLCPGQAFVPDTLLPVVALFDGDHSSEAIQAKLRDPSGAPLEPGFVRRLAEQLDEALLLDSPRFAAALRAAVEKFEAAGVRPASHAGSAGYPAAAQACAAALTEIVAPLSGDAASDRAELHGLVAPHIDLARGVEGYRAAYGRLAAARPADLYVVFGTGHQGPTAAVTGLAMDWATSVGVARTDRDFVAAVHRQLGPAAPVDTFLHRQEHSLEFQMLFLRHLLGDRPFEVAGFLTGRLPDDPEVRRTLTDVLRETAAASGKRICWVAGADLAHLGPFFGDAQPVDTALLARLERDERGRLARLEAGDPASFHAELHTSGNPDRICGVSPITLVAELAGGPGELLHYGQAAAPDGSQVVSFCSVAFAGA